MSSLHEDGIKEHSNYGLQGLTAYACSAGRTKSWVYRIKLVLYLAITCFSVAIVDVMETLRAVEDYVSLSIVRVA